MFPLLKRKKPDYKQIKEAREKFLDEALKDVAKLKRLISNPDSGWPEYVKILKRYKKKIEKRKALTSLDTASDEAIAQLKILDHDKYMLNYFIDCVEGFFKVVEKTKEEVKRLDLLIENDEEE